MPPCNTVQKAMYLAVFACQLSATMAGVPVVPCKPDRKARYSRLAPSRLFTHSLLVCSLMKEGLKLGFPLLVKARLGGGGKGMKLARHADDLEASLAENCLAPMQPQAR